MKSKIILTMLLTWSLGASVAFANTPLVFQEDLSVGIDVAFKNAFDKATATLAPGEKLDISLEDMYATCQNLSIDNDKLEVMFDEIKIKQTLNSMGISSWEGMSEPVLMWLCDGKSIFSADNDDNAFVKDLLNNASQERYKIMLPLMDLDDIQSVSVETILNHDINSLAKASSRYGSSFFIVGLLNQSESGLQEVKWEVLDNKAKSLDSNISNGENISKDMAAGIADTLMKNTQNTDAADAKDYFTLGAGADFVRILITNVQNVADYDKIIDILVTYGYPANSPIVARTAEGIIVEIQTGASVDILDGTLAHSGDFTKTASWTYTFNKSSGAVSAGRSGIGKGSTDLIRSTIEIKEPVVGNIEQ